MYTFEDLKNIIAKLRARDGCSWTRAQTHESIKPYLVEECGEVLEAIDNHDVENLCEELGDVLYHIMIHSEMEKEAGHFTVDHVIDGICRKMVRRHPQVFGGVKIGADRDDFGDWEEMKRRERMQKEKEHENGKKP